MARKRNPAAGRPDGRTAGKSEAKKVKKSISLPAETARRLNILAASQGKHPGELAAEAIEAHLRQSGLVVSFRGGPAAEAAGPPAEAPAVLPIDRAG